MTGAEISLIRDKVKPLINPDEKTKIAGMGDVVFGREDEVLVTLALGSCIALVLYDDKKKVAGLAHIMQPEPLSSRENISKLGKYVTTAVPYMLSHLSKMGANISNLKAKMAGGASMFTHTLGANEKTIGAKNVEKAEQLLKMYGIPIIAKDVLGNVGRSVKFYVSTTELIIKTRNKTYKI